jgi:hypothetical protein
MGITALLMTAAGPAMPRTITIHLDDFGSIRSSLLPAPLDGIIHQTGLASVKSGVIRQDDPLVTIAFAYNQPIRLKSDITSKAYGKTKIVIPAGTPGFEAPQKIPELENARVQCFFYPDTDATYDNVPCYYSLPKTPDGAAFLALHRGNIPMGFVTSSVKVSRPETETINMVVAQSLNLSLRFKGWARGDAFFEWVSNGVVIGGEVMPKAPNGRVSIHVDSGIITLEPNLANNAQALAVLHPLPAN